jgi:hypothetical protein
MIDWTSVWHWWTPNDSAAPRTHEGPGLLVRRSSERILQTTMRLEISTPFLESWNRKGQSLPGEGCRKLQTHRIACARAGAAAHIVLIVLGIKGCGRSAVR